MESGRTNSLLAGVAGFVGFVAVAALVILVLVKVGEDRSGQRVRPAAPADSAPDVDAPRGARDGRRIFAIDRFAREVAATLESYEVPASPLPGPLRVSLAGVRWLDPAGRPFFTSPRVRISVDGGALLDGRLVSGASTFERPEVLLVRGAAQGSWNYLPIFAGDGTGEPPRPGNVVELRGVVLERGRIEIRFPGERYLLEDVNARLARVQLPAADPAEATVDVGRWASTLHLPEAERPMPLVLVDGTVRSRSGRFPFEVRSITLAGTEVERAAGLWDPDMGGYGITGTAERVVVGFGAMREFFPGLPPDGTAVFALRMEALAGGRTRFDLGSLDLAADGSRIRGELAVVLETDRLIFERMDLQLDPLDLELVRRYADLPYSGTLQGRVTGVPEDLRFDVFARLRDGELAEPVEAALAGRLALSFGPPGARLRALEATVTDLPLQVVGAFAPGLPLGGTVSGTISLTGPPGESPLNLDVRLRLAQGVAVVRGTLDLTGATAAYDLSGRLIAIDLRQLLEPDFPPVVLTGPFTLSGRGTDPATATARLTVDGRLSGWVTAPGDALAVEVGLSGGLLDVRRFAARAGPVRLDADGSWRLAAPEGGGIRYALTIDDLEPLAPYIDLLADDARGGLDTRGLVTGTLDSPTIQGNIAAFGLAFDGWEVERGEAAYHYSDDDPLPVMHLRFTASGIATAGAGEYESATGTFDLTRPDFVATLRADRVGGGVIEFASEGTLRPDMGEALVQEFRIDLEDQRWELEAPASIRWGATPGVVVERLVISRADGFGRVVIDGRIPTEDAADLNVEVVSLPLREIMALAGFREPLGGVLHADLHIGGTRFDPVISGEARLFGASYRGARFAVIRTDLDYRDERLRLEGAADVVEPAGRLLIDAAVPVRITLGAGGITLLDDEPLRASATAGDFPLRTFGEFMPQLDEVRGFLDANVEVAGTIADPRLSGDARVREGAARVRTLERRFENIGADFALVGNRIQIQRLEARSDGWARAEGVVTLESEGPVADVEVELEGIRPVAFDGRPAVAAWGTVTVTGPLERPVIRGSVRIEDGTIVVPDAGPPAAFEEGVVPARELPEAPVGIGARAAPTPGPFAGFLIDDMRVEIGDDVWFVAEEARVQLAGVVRVRMTPQTLEIVGDLTGERGTFTLRAGPVVRRFDIVEANVRFFGHPRPNPAIDVTASRVVPLADGGRLEVLVRLAGTLESPTIALATAGGQTIPEAELLSYLLFGQPGVGLGGALPGEAVVQAALLGGVGDIAALQLEQALAAEFGGAFDIFQIRFGPGAEGPFGLGLPTVVLGRELTDNVFLTAEMGLTALFGPDAGGRIWSIVLDWRIDREWSAELGYGPVYQGRLFRRVGAPIAILRARQELFVEVTRRWMY